MYVRNCLSCSARSDVNWRTPYLATQPELGVWSDRRTGLGSGNSGGPAFARHNLSGRGANSDARRPAALLCAMPVAPFGEGSQAEREDHHPRWPGQPARAGQHRRGKTSYRRNHRPDRALRECGQSTGSEIHHQQQRIISSIK